MKKRVAIKFISLLIIISLLIQLNPIALTNAEEIQTNTHKSKGRLLSVKINNEVLAVERGYVKPVLQKKSIKYYPVYITIIYSISFLTFNSIYHEEIFDFRKSIKQSIPLYFNGGKYKVDYLET